MGIHVELGKTASTQFWSGRWISGYASRQQRSMAVHGELPEQKQGNTRVSSSPAPSNPEAGEVVCNGF